MFSKAFSTLSKSSLYLAFIYIVLLFFDIPLYGKLAIHDLLVPFFILILFRHRKELCSLISSEALFLFLFLIISGIISLFHYFQGYSNFYDFAVFSYMFLLYLFFRLCPFSEKHSFYLGASLLASLFILFTVANIGLLFSSQPWQNFFYWGDLLPTEGADFLQKRFMAFFNNPNYLGSFYALPYALCLPGLQNLLEKNKNWFFRIFLVILLFLSLLPLISSASKHAVISVALLSAAALQSAKKMELPATWLTNIPLFAFAALCIITIVVPVFPLQKQFPYINKETQSNYSLHQEIYLKMIFSKASYTFFGIGNKQLRKTYPAFADEEKTVQVLKQYQAGKYKEAYLTFMDPHNEYLNIAAFFGIPAMLLMLFFWSKQLKSDRYKKSEMLLYFVVALAVACFWDDLLSKRWLWITLAVLLNNKEWRVENQC